MPKYKPFLLRQFSHAISDMFETDLYKFACKIKNIKVAPQKHGFNPNSISAEEFDHLLKCQMTSRLIDFGGQELYRKKLGFYDLNNLGHEGLVGIAFHLKLSDPKLLHYRSGAAFVEWLIRAQQDPIAEVLGSIVCAKSSFSGGSHKVFGSLEASVIPQTSTIASQMPKAVGLGFAIHKAQQLKVNGRFPDDSVVFCSFGDGSFNHGSAQEAFNMIEWLKFTEHPMPILMICENNGLSISSENPPGFIESAMSKRHAFHYVKINSLDIIDTFEKSKAAVAIARESRRPVFLDIKTSRLGEHYLSKAQNEESHFSLEKDPVLCSMRTALTYGYSMHAIIDMLYSIGANVSKTLKQVTENTDHDFSAKNTPFFFPEKGTLKVEIDPRSHNPSMTLAQTLNASLKEIMAAHKEVIVFGDDAANEKGGVWGITKDLGKIYGKERVFNTTISETSILANAQMMGLNGLMPIVEIRHLAFLHNAIDQIRGEASTTKWLSNGNYASPFLLRIPGLGYNVNGGHFHNDATTAALREIPGVVIACASCTQTAGALLKYCVDVAFEHGNIVIFIEPISLYHKNDVCYTLKDRSTSLTKVGIYGTSDVLTIISYGNGFDISMRAAAAYKARNIDVQVLDLRWLKPLSMESICEAIKSTPNVLIVDEARKTGSLSEEIFTRIHEESKGAHQIFRITGDDAFAPLGKSVFSIFPSQEKITHLIDEKILAPARKSLKI